MRRGPLRVRRPRRRGTRCQATIETAIIIPILLALLANFIGLMVQVSLQQEVDAAVRLAANSAFQAATTKYDQPGDRCCGAALPPQLLPTFSTGGLPTRCRFAAESFYGTIRLYSKFLDFTGFQRPFCTNDGVSSFLGVQAPPGDVQCDIYYQDRVLYTPSGSVGSDPYNPGRPETVPPVIRCTATVMIRMDRSPISWAVRWNPTVTVTTEEVPPPFRQ